MALNIKLLYRCLPWCLAFGVALVALFSARAELTQLEQQWQERLQWQRAHQYQHWQLTEQHLIQRVQLATQRIGRDAQVLAILRRAALLQRTAAEPASAQDKAQLQRLRSELALGLKPYWQELQAPPGHELNIYLMPGAISFLRMQKPEHFGDSLIGASNLIAAAMTEAQLVWGLEVSRAGSAYRALLPVFDAATSTPVAIIEVGASLLSGQGLGAESVFMATFLHKSSMNSALWQPEQRLTHQPVTTIENWGLEATRDTRLHDWWSQGLVRLDEHSQLINASGQTLLASWWPLTQYGQDLAQPELGVLTWQDLSLPHSQYLAARDQLVWHWAGFFLVAALLLLALVNLNTYSLRNLVKAYSIQVKAEHQAFELAHQRLALALRSSDSGFWEWDMVQDKAKFSPEWRNLCGIPPESPESLDLDEWMSRVHPADKRISYSDMIRHIKGETPMYENEYRLRISDGSYKWILTRGKVVEWNPQGRATLMLGVYSDITERKQAELISIRQQAALQALNEIAALPGIDATEQLRQALELGARYLGVTSAYIKEVKGDNYRVRVHYSTQTRREDPEQLRPLHQCFCQLTMAARELVAEDNIPVSNYAEFARQLPEPLGSYIGVPLFIGRPIYGTLSFCARKTRHHQYDELDKNFVKLLARWVCSVMERWQQDQDKKIILQRFQKLNERLPGFLYQYQLRPDGSSFFPYASPGIYNIYHVSAEEVAQSADKIFTVIHPDDRAWVEESVRQSAQSLCPWVASVRIINPKRGLLWTHIESIPERLDDGSVLWHGYVSDITALKDTENQLQEIHTLRKAILDAASIAIVSTDMTGMVKTFNHGAECLLGYSAEEVVDKVTLGLWHQPAELERCARDLSQQLGRAVAPNFELFALLGEAGDEREWSFLHKAGCSVPVVLTLSALRDAHGNISGYLGIARDISELKRIDTMKAEFISTVSHELRTPLTAISGALGLLSGGMLGDLSAQAQKMLKIAHSNAMRLIYLVNDLLDMEKLVAGKMHFDFQEYGLLELVEQALVENDSYAQQYGVSYRLVTADANLRIWVDAQRLQQVLSNYLSNAAKFSPSGAEVEVEMEQRDDWIRVTVTDKGPGVPEGFRDRLFQKFSQADASDTRKKGGTGLGLAICKEIIERMHGRLGMEPAPEGGACFYFELPKPEQAAPLVHPTAPLN